MDLIGELLLSNARANHRAPLDFVEQLRRFVFCVEQPFHPNVFGGRWLPDPHNAMLCAATTTTGAGAALAVPVAAIADEYLVGHGFQRH